VHQRRELDDEHVGLRERAGEPERAAADPLDCTVNTAQENTYRAPSRGMGRTAPCAPPRAARPRR
jgi:hypothetical protein